MLRELTVENIAIIDRADCSLNSGLTALTGETGAGKSLVVDAIGLVLGGRASVELVRSGAEKGSVWLKVDLAEENHISERCKELGIELEEGCLLIHRELSAKGGSSVRINGRPASVGVLKELGSLMVDLHGQHDHQSLLDEEKQIQFLDTWIGKDVEKGKSACSAAHAELESVRRRLNSLRSGRRAREQRLDMLRFQVEEITSLEPRIGEIEELEGQVRRLQNVEKLRLFVGGALDLFTHREAALLDQMSDGVGLVESAARLDETLDPALQSLTAAQSQITEAARDLRHYLEDLESDPEALEATAARLDSLKKLMRKYGESIEEVLDYLAKAEAELNELVSDEGSEEELEAKEAECRKALVSVAGALTKVRQDKAKEFTKAVLQHVRELAMPKADFLVKIEAIEPGPEGADQVSFLFSANPGEPLMALSRVASGGELSRVMLAIKASGAGRAGVPTLIFDEVDTGLSGRAAAVMAKKLREIAQHRQVIVISHLPQIAGQANRHIKIEKVEQKGRSVTRLTELGSEERVLELARMLAGEEIGESALANARELLKA